VHGSWTGETGSVHELQKFVDKASLVLEREFEEVKINMDNAHPYTSDKQDCAREDHTQSEATEPSRESCSDGAQEEEGSELCDNSHCSSHSSDWSHVSPGRYAVPLNISCVQPLGGCKATPQVRTLCVNFRMLGEWMDFSILWTDGLEAVL